MYKPVVTRAIVLSRVEYGEADRIITFLTPDRGKVAVMAKGVRKAKSKLAGGIELFSISDITYIVGKGEISTLIASRLHKHYGNIVKQTVRTGAGYEIIKTVNKATEQAAEEGYFDLLRESFEALDNLNLKPEVTTVWFNMQLLKLTGHMPNLQTDTAGRKLEAERAYDFHLDAMRFGEGSAANFNTSLIKFLRLGFQASKPTILNRVKGSQELVTAAQPLVLSMLKSHVRI